MMSDSRIFQKRYVLHLDIFSLERAIEEFLSFEVTLILSRDRAKRTYKQIDLGRFDLLIHFMNSKATYKQS